MFKDNVDHLGIVKAKINVWDLFILLIMWLLVVITSVESLGVWPAFIFILLNMVLVARNTYNGILVMLLIFFSPSASLVGLPLGPFVFSFIIITVKYFIIDLGFNRQGLNLNKISQLAFIYVMYITITLVGTPDLELALTYYQKYIEGLIVLILVFGVIHNRNELGIVLKWWAIVASLSLLIKLIHVHFGVDTALFNLLNKVDVGSAFNLEHRLNINIGGEISRRLLWPGEEPNYASANLIFPFAIALGFYAATQGWVKWGWALIALLITASVVGSFSRSGFLAIVLVLTLFAIKGRSITVFISAGLVGAVVLILVSTIPLLGDRLFSINEEIQEGGSGRYDLWSKAIELWLESPIWGNGFASYYYHDVAAHNTFLQVLAETGLIGLTVFLLLIFNVIKLCLKHRKIIPAPNMADVQFTQILLIGFIGMTVFLATVSYQDIKLYWIVCAICTAVYFVSKKELHKNIEINVNK